MDRTGTKAIGKYLSLALRHSTMPIPFDLSLFRLFFALFFLALAPLPAWAAKAPLEPAATVISVAGDVTVDRGGAILPLALTDPVYERDAVRTGPDGKAQLLFTDASTVSLAPGSIFEMEAYADAGKESQFAAELFQGAVRIITGGITERNPKGFKITTPLATVGIRGTILYIEADDKHTTVKVLNSEKSVRVNDVEVKESFKVTVRRDADPLVEPLAPGEAVEIADAFAQAPGAPSGDGSGAANGGGDLGSGGLLGGDGGLMADVTEHPAGAIPIPAGPMTARVVSPLVGYVFPPNPYAPNGYPIANPASTSIFTGVTNTYLHKADYDFDINLLTGDITNANAEGYVGFNNPEIAYASWQLHGGTGNFLTGVTWTTISSSLGMNQIDSNPSALGSSADLNSAATNMTFTGSYANVGDAVYATLTLQNAAGDRIVIPLPEPGIRQ